MTHDDAFLQAIIESPDDDSLRLIYADWLEDHGQPERAAFIRVQCELARDALRPDSRREDLEARERALLERHEGEWLGPVRGLVKRWTFRRGFLEGVGLGAEEFLTHAEALCSQAPVRLARLEFGPDTAHGTLARLCRCSHLGRLDAVRLCFDPYQVDDAGLRALAGCPPLLRRLDTLSATECMVSGAGLRAVVTSPHLLRLRRLHLNDCGLAGEQGVRPLADSPQLARLADLSLRENALGDRGVRVLAASPNCGRLVSLDLAGCGVTDAGAEALARSPHLGRLEWLYLYENRLTQRGVRVLAYSRGLARLREVWLWDNRIGEADQAWLKARFGDRVHL
jgi:uncharacterized protein (TIGR02996 family)